MYKNIEDVVWLGPKREIAGQKIQESYKLIDSSQEELRNYYTQCK